MSTKTWQRIFSFVVLASLLISLTTPRVSQAKTPAHSLAAPAAQEDPLTIIEQQVLDEIAEKGQTDYFVTLKEKADLSSVVSQTTKLQKGEYVFNTLRVTADRTQKDLRAYLDAQSVSYTPYSIVNTVLVRGGSRDLLLAVASRPDVASVNANHTYQFEQSKMESAPQAPSGVEPNLSFVNADDVWALGVTGEGVVLAGNDTGMNWTHPAIKPHYRGWNGVTVDHNYNWWDATGTYPNEPNDGMGQGTLTTGIMVGDDGTGNQIGMAPGAKTIHCKNTTDYGATNDIYMLTCYEWDLAPWDLTGNNPRPDLAPDLIHSSVGPSGGGNSNYRTAIDNLIAAGILVESPSGDVFSGGCSMVVSPGDYQEVLTTGAAVTGPNGLPGYLYWFTARGPSLLDGDFVPDILAPGYQIRSAYYGEGYAYLWYTTAAGPHAAGLVGLMWSANPALHGDVETTIQIIQDTAVPLTGQMGYNCGGDYTDGPNNDWGYGTIDALAAVQAAIAYGGSGMLQGTVTDSISGVPIPAANINATLSITQSFQTTTDPSGFYTMGVTSGTYDVESAAFGYLPNQASGVVVGEGQTVSQDFELVKLPTHVISVTVVDAVTGWPLYAAATLGGAPLAPLWTDPLTGHFEVTVPDGSVYTLSVDAWTPGYLHQNVDVGPIVDDVEVVIPLEPDGVACIAPGYEFTTTPITMEDFEASDGGYTVSGDNASWEWGAPIYGPGAAHSGANVWATGLISGTYHDNENSYLTSPLIDLSSQAGKVIVLGWWQWLQVENNYDYADLQASKDGGASWSTVYGPNTGDVDLSWGHQFIQLDPSYAVSNFQVRYHLVSDYSYDLPGWYVDDLGVQAGECLPLSGGLVVGNVSNANDGLPLQGATVENDSGLSTLTNATQDPNVADGFYILFSPEGLHDLTASLENYTAVSETVDVPSGGFVWQDFSLPAGHLAFDPHSMNMTLELGGSATLPLTITNDGHAATSFAILEAETGFQPVGKMQGKTVIIPATPAEPPIGSAVAAAPGYKPRPARAITIPSGLTPGPDVFIACADDNPCEPIASMLMAFGDIGSVTSFDARYDTPTLDQLLHYDVVLTWLQFPYADAEKLGDVLADYVDAGGKVINLVWALAHDDWGLQGRFVTENYTAMKSSNYNSWGASLGAYDASHPIMQGITDVWDYWRVGGTSLTPGSTAVANWSDGTIFVAAKDDRSVVSLNTYVGVYYYWAGQVDQVVHNAVRWLGIQEVPWLSEDPITGTLQADTGLQDVSVSFDADASLISQPGEYAAQLKIVSDTPDAPVVIPVNMTVTPPQTFGKLEGTVQSLGSCDDNPAPLARAVVSIVSQGGNTWTVRSDETGHYQAWMDAVYSPVTVTVTADEHIAGGASNVIIYPDHGVTTQDIGLRWLSACIRAAPSPLVVDVPLGYDMTVMLNLLNNGPVSSEFGITEGEGVLHQPGAAVQQVMDVAITSYIPQQITGGMVAILKDVNPWGTTEVEAFLAANSIPYQVHTSSEFGTLDFSNYNMIVFSADQTRNFYDTYALYVDKFESYVEGGGLLIFLAADMGWDEGASLYASLPGGVIYNTRRWEEWNIVDDPSHPVMAGVPSTFWFQFASLGNFTNVPADAHVIVRDQIHGFPTTIEYPLGNGWVIAFGQGLEIAHAWGLDFGVMMDNALLYGYGFQSAQDIPWIMENPITGTVDQDSSLPVDVTFTAFPTMTVGDIFTTSLTIRSFDIADPKLVVPVTMHVVLPVYGVAVSADQVGSGKPGEEVTYTFTVTNTSNFASDSFTVTLGAHAYDTGLGPGEDPTLVVGPLAMDESTTYVVTVHIPLDAMNGDYDTAAITVTSVGDPTKSATTNVTTNVSILTIYLPLIWKAP